MNQHKKIQNAKSGSQGSTQPRWYLHDHAIFLTDAVIVTQTQPTWESQSQQQVKYKYNIYIFRRGWQLTIKEDPWDPRVNKLLYAFVSNKTVYGLHGLFAQVLF